LIVRDNKTDTQRKKEKVYVKRLPKKLLNEKWGRSVYPKVKGAELNQLPFHINYHHSIS